MDKLVEVFAITEKKCYFHQICGAKAQKDSTRLKEVKGTNILDLPEY